MQFFNEHFIAVPHYVATYMENSWQGIFFKFAIHISPIIHGGCKIFL